MMSGLTKWFEKDTWVFRVFDGDGPATDITLELFDTTPVLSVRKIDRTPNQDGYYSADDSLEVVLSSVEVELTLPELARIARVFAAVVAEERDAALDVVREVRRIVADFNGLSIPEIKAFLAEALNVYEGRSHEDN